MVRGFFRMVEVFLALFLLFSALSVMEVHNFPKYSDPGNTARMYDVARRIALSYNGYRTNISRNVLVPPDNSTLPDGVEYKILLYANGTGHSLGVLVNQTGEGPPNDREMASYSLLVSGAAYTDPGTGNRIVEYAPRRLVVMAWRA